MTETTVQASIFQRIKAAVKDGELPEMFSVSPASGNENEIRFADGALDGIRIYHMAMPEITEETESMMERAVTAAGNGAYETAESLFEELGRDCGAAVLIDALQNHIMSRTQELDPNVIASFANRMVTESYDRECVKFGLAILELFNTDEIPSVKEIVKTAGLSDEFALFSIFVMMKWRDGNQEIFELAKKLHGWGRIHAVERIEPRTAEIRRWFLMEGVDNNVMPSYSALSCWIRSDAEQLLNSHPSEEEFSGIRKLLSALLDEGPVQGISALENAEEIILSFLKTAGTMRLTIADYELIYEIQRRFAKESESIAEACRQLFSADACRRVIEEAAKGGRDTEIADEMGIEFRSELLDILASSFAAQYMKCGVLMKDKEYRDRVIRIFAENLPLAEMAAGPGLTLGLGKEYWREAALECLLQQLGEMPMEGQQFVETALQCAPVRTRNCGLNVLESWVNSASVPLKELLPGFYQLLKRLRDTEPDEKVKARMDRLTAGEVKFENSIE
jgi:hypothetical protein